MTRVITIAQQKGGAGKTTLAAQLAVAWRTAGRRVALIDIDPQGSLGAWYALRVERLGEEAAGLTFKGIKGWSAAGAVRRLADDHDLVIVDSPPHAESEARIAVRAADLVLVPVQPSPMDLWATRETLEIAERERRPALVVLNRVPARGRIAEEMAAEARRLGVPLARTTVGNRVAFAASLAAGRGVSETAPASPAGREIAALAREIGRRRLA